MYNIILLCLGQNHRKRFTWIVTTLLTLPVFKNYRIKSTFTLFSLLSSYYTKRCKGNNMKGLVEVEKEGRC